MNKNTSGIKSSDQVLKGLVKKDVKSNGQPRPSAFDEYKSFDHDDLPAKHCYFRPPNVDGIKILDKGD